MQTMLKFVEQFLIFPSHCICVIFRSNMKRVLKQVPAVIFKIETGPLIFHA